MDENMQFTTSPNTHSVSPIDSLTERVFMFLEDSNWDSANDYCERILDIEPTNALAYLGKLMSEYKVSAKEQLGELKVPLNDNGNYQKIMLFGDEKLKGEIAEYNEQNISAFNAAKRKKKRRTIIISSVLSSICVIALLVWLIIAIIIPTVKYNQAESYLADGDYETAISVFSSLGDFKDSVEKNISSKYKWACELINSEDYDKAYEVLKDLGEYEDSRTLLRETSWEIICKYLEGKDTFQIPIETSMISIKADDDQILLGYQIVFDDSIKVDARYVASLNKDGSVPILGVSDCEADGGSIEYVEALGYWDIGTFKDGDAVGWDEVNEQRTGFFNYIDESMFITFSDNAFDSMIIGLQALLEQSETGVTLQDLGFYSYE